jgi:hypothetical protein
MGVEREPVRRKRQTANTTFSMFRDSGHTGTGTSGRHRRHPQRSPWLTTRPLLQEARPFCSPPAAVAPQLPCRLALQWEWPGFDSAYAECLLVRKGEYAC